MSFARLAGNRAALARLRQMASSGRVPASLLLSGPEGVGKLKAAITLAKVLNCTEAGPGRDEPCERCAACLHIERGDFADVRRIGPQGTGGQIKVDAVREAIVESPFRPFVGKKRVFIFEEADRMNPAAANSLLKTLEEPPACAVFILLTAHEAAILPTLLSRCQRLRFFPLLPEEVEQVLVGQHGLEPAPARLLAAVSGGSVGRALAARAEEVALLRDDAVRLAGALADRMSRADLFARAETLSKEAERLKTLLGLLLGVLRDVLSLAGGESGALLHSDLRVDLELLARRAPLEAWAEAFSRVERAIQDLDHYANKRITVESLFLDLNGIGPGVKPSFQGRGREASA